MLQLIYLFMNSIWYSSFLAQCKVQNGKLMCFHRVCVVCYYTTPHLAAHRASLCTFIEFAIIISLQFPVFCVCPTERGRDGDWETLDRGNSINCAFYENARQSLSPCLITCLPGSCSINPYLCSGVTKTRDTHRPTRIHTEMHTCT